MAQYNQIREIKRGGVAEKKKTKLRRTKDGQDWKTTACEFCKLFGQFFAWVTKDWMVTPPIRPRAYLLFFYDS
jgi:hypothetical protein